jgi:hypothetical protein
LVGATPIPNSSAETQRRRELHGIGVRKKLGPRYPRPGMPGPRFAERRRRHQVNENKTQRNLLDCSRRGRGDCQVLYDVYVTKGGSPIESLRLRVSALKIAIEHHRRPLIANWLMTLNSRFADRGLPACWSRSICRLPRLGQTRDRNRTAGCGDWKCPPEGRAGPLA